MMAECGSRAGGPMVVKWLTFSFLLTGIIYGTWTSPAYAYLDPGTGSMILQMLLGGIAGAALAGRFYWNRLLVFIGVRSEQPAEPTGEDAKGQ